MKSLYICFIILCMLSILSADPLFEFEPEIVDAASAAMGRTSVLSTSGSNAVFTNPAKLYNLNDVTFQGGGRLLIGADSYSYIRSDYDSDQRTYPGHVKLNHFSFAIPFNQKVMPISAAIAGGYRTYYDFGYNYGIEDANRANTDSFSREFNFHGGLNTIVMGGAINVRNVLVLGISYNHGVMGDVTENAGDYQSYTEYEFQGTIDGSFASYGLIYRGYYPLEIGFYYRPGFTIDLEGDFNNLLWGMEDHDHIDIPPLFAYAIAFQLNNDSFITLEYQTRKLDEYKEDEIYYYWHDTEPGYSIRMGGSFGKAISVRMGMFIDSIPNYDISVNGYVSKNPSVNAGFTGGIGLFRDKAYGLDVYGKIAFTNTRFEYYDVEYTALLLKLGATFTYSLKKM